MNPLDQFLIMPTSKLMLIGFSVAAMYWVIMYDGGDGLVKQTQSLRSKIANTETQLRQKEMSLKRSRDFKETLRIKDEQFQAFSSYIPENLSVADMMRVISSEAKAAGVNIIGISASEAPKVSKNELTESLAIRISLSGAFPQQILFLSFLSRLESIFTVSDMSFTAEQNKGDNDNVAVKFDAVIVGYRYLGDQSIAPGGK